MKLSKKTNNHKAQSIQDPEKRRMKNANNAEKYIFDSEDANQTQRTCTYIQATSLH